MKGIYLIIFVAFSIYVESHFLGSSDYKYVHREPRIRHMPFLPRRLQFGERIYVPQPFSPYIQPAEIEALKETRFGSRKESDEIEDIEQDSEVLQRPYGDDEKSYQIGIPLPEISKDVDVLGMKCLVPTRRGMILTHCGLVDDEGSCPAIKSCGYVIPRLWTLPKLCLSDFDCPLEQKCCSHPCYQHNICQAAVSESMPTNLININQYINIQLHTGPSESKEDASREETDGFVFSTAPLVLPTGLWLESKEAVTTGSTAENKEVVTTSTTAAREEAVTTDNTAGSKEAVTTASTAGSKEISPTAKTTESDVDAETDEIEGSGSGDYDYLENLM